MRIEEGICIVKGGMYRIRQIICRENMRRKKKRRAIHITADCR